MSEVLYGDKGCEVTFEFHGELPFVHLEIKQWNKSTLKRLREVFTHVGPFFDEQGYAVYFATTQEPKALKLWKAIRPWDELKELKKGGRVEGWLGAWYTEM